ncbi:hypothetical protein [Mycolicibacterium farcinogenes]|uniref:Uncharacterized protein n=1 Tax=Mycolicibacterium farcinogenes TaxID=1802 RepID=A0ACD1FD75_MYCFR|nr:hypothetical protein [Mycolicibacterium farcinogenes]QZH65018.1 hypothetical protein K6L26_23905 [Mycolicibacterium farcinogenes]
MEGTSASPNGDDSPEQEQQKVPKGPEDPALASYTQKLRRRAAFYALLLMAVEAIFVTVGIVFRWPATVLIMGAIGLLAIAVGAFVTVNRELIQEFNTPKRWSKPIGAAATVIFLVCALTITVTVVRRATATSQALPISAKVMQLPLDRDTPPDAENGRNWSLVVPDVDSLQRVPRYSPPQLPPGKDCADLWRMGVDAGGQQPTTATYKVQIWGKVPVSVVDLRARILQRDLPASDGALLMCTPFRPGPPVPDEPVSCDLTQRLENDAVSCTVKDDAAQTVLLRNVKSIPLRPDAESTSLQVTVRLPDGDAVEWQLEANVSTPDGPSQDRWVAVGNSMRSLGQRDMNAGEFYQRYIAASILGTLEWKPGDPSSPPTLPPPSTAPHP